MKFNYRRGPNKHTVRSLIGAKGEEKTLEINKRSPTAIRDPRVVYGWPTIFSSLVVEVS